MEGLTVSEFFDSTEIVFGVVSEHIREPVRIGDTVGPLELKRLWQSSNDLPDGTGLYVYSKPSGQVVYVGVGNVRARAWQHLRTPQQLLPEGAAKELGFPNHQWAAHLDQELNELFRQGTMCVSAVSVQPRELTHKRHWPAKFAVVHNAASQCGIFLQTVW